MKSKHLLGLETQIKRNISELVSRDVQKNIGFVTITDVELTSDYSYCTVYYNVLNPKDQKKAYDGLNGLKGYFRKEIGKRVSMKKLPEISFKYDESYDNGRMIDEILARLNEEKKES